MIRKKQLIIIILTLFLLIACEKDELYIPLEQLSDDYNLIMAKKDMCIVYEDGDITDGQLIWDEFVNETQKSKPSMVRLVFYYTLGDSSQYTKESYEEIKDDYPKLFPIDLIYDGDKYSVKSYDEGKLIIREYSYMMKYEGQPNKQAIFSEYTYFVLVNDNTVTWGDILSGMYSSQSGDAIDHYRVYTDIVYK